MREGERDRELASERTLRVGEEGEGRGGAVRWAGCGGRHAGGRCGGAGRGGAGVLPSASWHRGQGCELGRRCARSHGCGGMEGRERGCHGGISYLRRLFANVPV